MQYTSIKIRVNSQINLNVGTSGGVLKNQFM